MNIRTLIAAGVAIGLLAALTITPTQGDNIMAAPGTIANQLPHGADFVVRKLADLERQQREGLASIADSFNTTVAALPRLASQVASSSGFGLTAGWNDYATVTIAVPAGKTHATIQAVGGCAAVDMTSGGVTSASARILINGTASASFPSAKDAGASAVNNVMSPSSGAAITVSGTVTVELQINPLNATAFPAEPGNFASLSVIAMFTA
jgi:hypothetical protein